jgi:CBS domain-containing protein
MSSSTIVDRISTLLDNAPPFDRLPPGLRRELISDVSIEYFTPGEVIIEHAATNHPGLYVVESGLVRLMDVVSQRLIGKAGEGEHFGSFGLIKGGMAIYEAKAVDPTVCALLRAERFHRLYERYEEFAAYFDSEFRMYVRRMGSAMDVSGAHLLFSRGLSQLTHRKLVSCGPDLSVRDAAALMMDRGVDSIVVVDGGRVAGILTGSDLREFVVGERAAEDVPVRRVMSSPVVTISSDASMYDAIMTMITERVHRIVMIAPEGRGAKEGLGAPVTVLTDRDIAHFRGNDPVATTRRIDHASSVDELANIRGATHEHLLNLYRQGALPEMLNRMMMVFYDRLVLRVLTLAERDLRASRSDHVDVSWAWIRLGSGGREEMALNSEQHNALIYSDLPSSDEAVRAEAWFNQLAERVNDALTACGFTPSEYVARDARWRQSLRAWKRTYREWILESDEALLAPTPIFFDLRCVYGDASLVRTLMDDIFDALNVQAMDESRTFLRMMAAHAIEHRPSTSLLRKVLDRVGEGRNTFDVREGGIRPIVDAARVLALEARYFESTNTFDRLRHASRDLEELGDSVEDALEAYQYLVDFRLESQLRAVEAGDRPVNQIDASSLNKMQQRLLRNAFSRADDLQDALARRYDLSRKWLSREQLGF